jgi:tetratricopeptide (TPR) repeat protein
MKLFLWFLFSCNLVNFISIAQNQKLLDSLNLVYVNTKADTNKIMTLTEIASQYNRNKPDTSIIIAQKAFAWSETIKFKRGMAWAANKIGSAHNGKGNYELSLKFYQQSLNLFEDIKDKRGIATAFNAIGVIYSFQSDYQKALEYYLKSLKIKEEINDKIGIAISLGSIGLLYYYQTNYSVALEYYLKALKINEVLKDKKGISVSLINIGNVYRTQKKHELALEYYLKALEIVTSINDKVLLSASLNNIANIYFDQQNNNLALEYYLKCLTIREEIKDKRGISETLGSIANIYARQNNYSMALEYNLKSLKIKEEINYKLGIATSLWKLAEIYLKQKDYEKSIDYGQKALTMSKSINSLKDIAESTRVLYETYKAMGDYTKALEYHEFTEKTNDSIFNIEKSKSIANLESKAALEKKEQEVKLLEIDNELQKIAAQSKIRLLEIAKKEAETHKLIALANQAKSKQQADSLNALAQKTQLESEKLKAEDEKLKAQNQVHLIENQKQKEEKEFQQKINYLVLAGFFSVIIFSYFIFRSRRKIAKAYKTLEIANLEIQHKKEEIESQAKELQQTNNILAITYDELHKKNEGITASINYAKRIQTAILPFHESIAKDLGEENFFILFKPRDIVSGDFYFYEKVDNNILVAVADCTGHGVPGAFMSMIGTQILTEIIAKNREFSPNKILSLLHNEIRRTLQQSQNVKSLDGMDIIIISIVKEDEFTTVLYAGAMNSLYYVQNNEMNEIKADKKSIGGQQYAEETDRLFTNHQILLTQTKPKQETILYLATDGFKDQFGGTQNKKFMTKQFRELLMNISHKTMTEQKSILDSTINNWINIANEKQTDDITVMGLKI